MERGCALHGQKNGIVRLEGLEAPSNALETLPRSFGDTVVGDAIWTLKKKRCKKRQKKDKKRGQNPKNS